MIHTSSTRQTHDLFNINYKLLKNLSRYNNPNFEARSNLNAISKDQLNLHNLLYLSGSDATHLNRLLKK
jgi:hypothetical protein